MLENLHKILESGNASEREAAIKTLIIMDSHEARVLIGRIANDDFELPYLREMARNALGIRKRKPSKPPPHRVPSKLEKHPKADYVLYYIRVLYNEKRFYKIGVTRNGITERFREENIKIDKILYEERVIGALDAEQEVKEHFKKDLYPLGIFRNANGYTEFFDKDVLGLDSEVGHLKGK